MCRSIPVAASKFGGTSGVFLGGLKNPSPWSHDTLYESNQVFSFPLLNAHFISRKGDSYGSAIFKN